MRVTPEQAAMSSKVTVRFLGTAFTEDPRTLRHARELGLTGWAFFVAGLGAALGDVPAEIVTASVGFISPDAVRDAWDSARRIRPIDEIAALNFAECRRWGREKLDGFGATPRLADLAAQAVASVDATGMPLFAAWRAASEAMLAEPTDREKSPGATVAVLLHLLRHHRAAAHVLAVRAAGLTPLQAVVAGPDGESGAIAFGWQQPYPRPAPLLRRWLWAEAVTDRIAGEAFAGLDHYDRIEFVGLLEGAMDLAQLPTGELPQVRVNPARVSSIGLAGPVGF
jgi:helix-turn-helix protein